MGTGMGSFHSLCSFSIGTFPIPHDDERYHSTLRSYMFYELVLVKVAGTHRALLLGEYVASNIKA